MNKKESDRSSSLEDIYKILNLFELKSISTQRDIAVQLGYSLGKVNYLVNSLIRKGLIKLENFIKSDNKLGYRYILTPAGIEAKYRVTVEFLIRKEEEYEKLQVELDNLRRSLASYRIKKRFN